jgi:acyl-CoA synthetase (AMP-forming)/AMP-acid ligase II
VLALAALFVPAPGAPSDAGAVRRHLAAELPRFMVPAHVWAVEALPRLPSGKADRRAAAAQAAARLGAG